MSQQIYTRDEKIDYYTRKILNLRHALKQAEKRLEYIQGPEYQDFNSDLEKDLERAKRKRVSK